MSPAPASVVRARVRRRFTSQAEDVFDAWIDPVKIGAWFGPGLGAVTRAEIDPRAGGSFCIVQHREHGDATHTGEYLELERPPRLAFTWRTPPLTDRARIHVEIAPAADGSELTLLHEMDARWASFIDDVERSWSTILDAMAALRERRAGTLRT